MPGHIPFQRQPPGSPLVGTGSSQGPSRKPSVVEILSSPPPLPVTGVDHDDINSFSLSRKTSSSSRASSVAAGNANANSHSSSISGLDWSEIPLSELTEFNKLISIDSSYSVQNAFETLVSHDLTSVPVSLSKDDPKDLTSCITFDYSDLNTYLLLLMNKINFEELAIDDIGDASLTPQQKRELAVQTINKAKKGEEVGVDFIVKLHPKNPFLKFSEQELLYKVVEVFGNGVHRVAITNPTGTTITGILSQRRLLRYLWENARRFPSLENIWNSTLQELQIVSSNPIVIYEDQLLIDALHKMFHERISSLAVIDKSGSLRGNISILDLKNVSSSKNSHLLFKSVLNFISYNLTQKGMEEGQDQFPIFHVNANSSLGRVIAKLVATQAHRLWIVEPRSSHSTSTSSASSTYASVPSTVEATLNQGMFSNNEISGHHDKLVGVVTLTDILSLFASSKGRKVDPSFARNQRRRSSTSTTRSSFDGNTSASSNQELFRKSYLSSGKNESVFSKD